MVLSFKRTVNVPSGLYIDSLNSQTSDFPESLLPVFGLLIFHLPAPINTLSSSKKSNICSSKVAVTVLGPSRVISISLKVSVLEPDQVVKTDPLSGMAVNLITVP